MTTLLTPELIDRCHAGSRAKGFWDEVPPQGQQLMLVISELSEALEAHRKGRAGDLPRYLKDAAEWHEARQGRGDGFDKVFFLELVKDSVGDELADAYIRLCDFAGGYGLDKQMIQIAKCDPVSWVISGSLGEQLLVVTESVCELNKERRRSGGHGQEGLWCDAVTNIEVVCIQEGIDLATHIDLKLRYNATRPAKHGKAY